MKIKSKVTGLAQRKALHGHKRGFRFKPFRYRLFLSKHQVLKDVLRTLVTHGFPVTYKLLRRLYKSNHQLYQQKCQDLALTLDKNTFKGKPVLSRVYPSTTASTSEIKTQPLYNHIEVDELFILRPEIVKFSIKTTDTQPK